MSKNNIIEDIKKSKEKNRTTKKEEINIFKSIRKNSFILFQDDDDEIEKITEKENENLYNSLIREINEIQFFEKDKLNKYFNWKEEIEKKKNLLKEKEFIEKIDIIIKGAKQKQKLKIVERLEKLKKQVLNKEIGVERGEDILYSINNSENFV